MLYPTVSQLCNENINRYELVIAVAKCARHVTDIVCEAREHAEAIRESDRLLGKSDCVSEHENDKAVSVAVDKIYSGEYKILK